MQINCPRKIVIIGNIINLSKQQIERLRKIGQVRVVANCASLEDWQNAIQGANIICCDQKEYLLASIYNLKDVFITYPYVEIGDFDSRRLEKQGVYIANAKGANRAAVIEWTSYMILALLRKFPGVTNPNHSLNCELTQSLLGKRALIIGKGNIGTGVGEICIAFGMQVDYATRADNPANKAICADVIINCLSCNQTTNKLLDVAFFTSCKPGSYFVSFAMPYTYSVAGLIAALRNQTLAGAAIDFAETLYGDISHPDYKALAKAPNMLLTPHTAFATEQTGKNGLEIMVQNVEAFAAGRPQNILTK